MNKNILKKLSYGMYIITSKNADLLVGCVANSVMQINSDTVAISLNNDNYTTKVILEEKKFVINILPTNTDIELIKTFGFKKSNEVNKFLNVSYKLVDDVPIINNTCGYIICTFNNLVKTSTHTIILGKIINMQVSSELEPMTYKYYQENLKGTTSKNAPTYQEEKKTSNKNVFVCKICGYRYETDLDELPDDFKCPMCGVGKEYFEKNNTLFILVYHR